MIFFSFFFFFAYSDEGLVKRGRTPLLHLPSNSGVEVQEF